MNEDLKKEAQDISQKLGESKNFFDIRKEFFQNIDQNKSRLSYGLAIGYDGKVFSIKRHDDNKDSIIYEVQKEKEIRVLPWEDAVNDPELSKEVSNALQKVLGARQTADVYSVLNMALFSEGEVVVCPSGVVGSVSLKTIFKNSARDLLCIVVEEGATLSVLDDIDLSTQIAGRTVIVIVKEKAKIQYTQVCSGSGVLHSNLMSFVQKDGELSYTGIQSLSGGIVKTIAEHFLEGEDASSQTQNISISAGKSIVDIYNTTHHFSSRTNSLIQAVGVASDKGKTIYRSNIFMKKKGIENITGEQNARFLVLSKEAEVDVIPSLDISQKSVSCSHSVSVSFLKDSDLYYPQLRGLDKLKSGKMIVEGMLCSGLESIIEKKEKEFLRDIIYKKVSTINFR